MKRKRHQSRAQKQSVPLLTAAAIVLGAPALTAAPFCVFRDTNNNGVQDTGELGIPGVTVTAYDDAGTQLAQVMTIADGSYTLGLAADTDVQLEFTTIPVPFISGTSANSATTVIADTTDGYALALIRPADACEANPVVFTPCYVTGDPGTVASPTAAGLLDAVVAFRFDDSGTSTENKKLLANAAEVGATWGAAHDRVRDRAYVSAVVRRHVSLGPDGEGAIYSIDISDIDAPVVSTLITIPGTNPTGIALDNVSRDISGDAAGAQSPDAEGFAAAGRVGIGDIDITDDNSTLYATNLGGQDLVAVDLTQGTPAITSTIDIFDTTTLSPSCEKGEFRPWAVKVLGDEVYVGAVCSGELGGTLGSYVLKLNSAGTGFTQEFYYALPTSGRDQAWTRTGSFRPFTAAENAALLADSQWHNWLPASATSWGGASEPQTSVADPFDTGEDYVIYAQPMLSDIEFDSDGSIILGYNDRMAMVGGFRNQDPDAAGDWVTIGAGDIVRVCNASGTFALEGTASCPFPTAGENEFYAGDVWNNGSFDEHSETAFGSLAVKPDTSEVMVTVYDPLDGAGNFNAGGTRRLSNSTGEPTGSFAIYDSTSAGTTFAKAAGLGDLEIACELPIVFGNRFFSDTDGDGRQDPDEPGIPGVLLESMDPMMCSDHLQRRSLPPMIQATTRRSKARGSLHPSKKIRSTALSLLKATFFLVGHFLPSSPPQKMLQEFSTRLIRNLP